MMQDVDVSAHTLPVGLPETYDDALTQIIEAWSALILSGRALMDGEGLAEAITRLAEGAA